MLEPKYCDRAAETGGMPQPPFSLAAAGLAHLRAVTKRCRTAARTYTRAAALRQLRAGQPVLHVAHALQVSRQSVACWRDHYVWAGLPALDKTPRSGRPVRIDGKQRARVTARACSTPSESHARWTLRLRADNAVELGYYPHLSHS